MERRAVIDIGSNTIHLLVADWDGTAMTAIHDLRFRAGLGGTVRTHGAVGPQRTGEVAAVVHRYAVAARRYGARELALVGTQALRAAADRDAVIATLEAAAGAPVSLLPPAQEAALCLAGAALEPLPTPPFLFVDIGGGSCDFALVEPWGITAAASLPQGSSSLGDCLADDPPRPEQVASVRAVIARCLADLPLPCPVGHTGLLATGGAARRVRRQAGGAAHPHAGTAAAVLPNVVERLLSEPCGRWPHPLKRPDRAQMTRAGALVLAAVVERFRAPWWWVSAHGLREGVLWQLAQGCRPDEPVELAARLAGEQRTAGENSLTWTPTT